MAEKPRNREIVERLTARVREHYARQGQSMTSDKAKSEVVQMARVRDQQRADGSAKNKRKGVASGRIREKQERERIERSISERRTGRISIDYGRGKT